MLVLPVPFLSVSTRSVVFLSFLLAGLDF